MMTITIHQPQNKDGKTTPMCAFDPANGYVGHLFQNMTVPGAEQSVDNVTVKNPPQIVCARCGALWEREV
jgi:hypothetical protein